MKLKLKLSKKCNRINELVFVQENSVNENVDDITITIDAYDSKGYYIQGIDTIVLKLDVKKLNNKLDRS